MTIAYWCVFVAFLLNMISKGPVAAAMARQPKGYDNRNPRDQQAGLEGWGRRAVSAHMNGFEAFPGFAAAVLIAALAGADPAWTTRLAVTFVVARVLYIPLYIADRASLRSAVWTIGFLSTVAIFVLPILD